MVSINTYYFRLMVIENIWKVDCLSIKDNNFKI